MNPRLKRKLMQAKDYLSVLKEVIDENQETRGYKKQLASCAGCQPAYLSQVLNGKVHLTPEQAEKLCQLWNLTELESEYFFNLVLMGRAGTPSLRKRLQEKLSQLRQQWKKLDSTYEKPQLADADRAQLYYSSWLYSAIHILLTVPKLQTTTALAAHLKLEHSQIEDALRELERVGMVLSLGAGRWQTTQASVHSPPGSLTAEMHHRNWRIRALEAERNKPATARYTSVHTLSKADYLKILDILDDAIKDTRNRVAPSPEEKAACMIVDYFEI